MGAVETAVRALVDGLGVLSAHQKVTAATAMTLAGRLDAEVDGAKVSALSRELRLLVVTLVPAAAARQPVRVVDQVARIQDELARKRAEREASG